jgi:hypothetical protein
MTKDLKFYLDLINFVADQAGIIEKNNTSTSGLVCNFTVTYSLRTNHIVSDFYFEATKKFLSRLNHFRLWGVDLISENKTDRDWSWYKSPSITEEDGLIIVGGIVIGVLKDKKENYEAPKIEAKKCAFDFLKLNDKINQLEKDVEFLKNKKNPFPYPGY